MINHIAVMLYDVDKQSNTELNVLLIIHPILSATLRVSLKLRLKFQTKKILLKNEPQMKKKKKT